MSDIPEQPTKSRSASIPVFNADEIFAQKPPESLSAAKTGLSSSDSSIPGRLANGYRQLWEDSPLLAGATTVGAGGVGALTIKKMPRITSHAAGMYGLSKLILTDGPDLMSSSGFKDTSKYLLACGSDFAMVAGTAARYIPKVRGIATAITATGIGGRLGAEFLPETNPSTYFRPEQVKPAPLSSKETVGVLRTDGQKEDRPYDLFIPQDSKSKKLPVVLMLPGVQNDSAPGMERETRLNAMAKDRGFIAVYPHAKPREQPTMGKVYDWNSPGSGLTITDPSYDDVDYINDVLKSVKGKANVDDKAIYVVGFSSGGGFAQHLRGKMPGTFAGVGSLHGTLLGSESKASEPSAFVSVHSGADHMLPYSGGRGLMTRFTLPRVADSDPGRQIEEAARANGYGGTTPKIGVFDQVRVTEYSGGGKPPVKEYFFDAGARDGLMGGLIGRGRDGYSALHAIGGTGEGGWPIIGEKNRSVDTTKLIVDELLKYKKP